MPKKECRRQLTPHGATYDLWEMESESKVQLSVPQGFSQLSAVEAQQPSVVTSWTLQFYISFPLFLVLLFLVLLTCFLGSIP